MLCESVLCDNVRACCVTVTQRGGCSQRTLELFKMAISGHHNIDILYNIQPVFNIADDLIDNEC